MVQAFLDRIETVNEKINAVVVLAGDEALDAAREADAQLSRGELTGPLHGVPMTIKDSIDTAGVVTTYGTKGRSTFVPSKYATVVARLKSSGAILMGKTNTPEFTLSYETSNGIFGRVSFHTDNGIQTPTPEISQVVTAAASVLADAGARIDEARPTGIESSYDVILCPVNAVPAMKHGSESAQDLKPFSYTMTYNLTDSRMTLFQSASPGAPESRRD